MRNRKKNKNAPSETTNSANFACITHNTKGEQCTDQLPRRSYEEELASFDHEFVVSILNNVNEEHVKTVTRRKTKDYFAKYHFYLMATLFFMNLLFENTEEEQNDSGVALLFKYFIASLLFLGGKQLAIKLNYILHKSEVENLNLTTSQKLEKLSGADRQKYIMQFFDNTLANVAQGSALQPASQLAKLGSLCLLASTGYTQNDTIRAGCTGLVIDEFLITLNFFVQKHASISLSLHKFVNHFKSLLPQNAEIEFRAINLIWDSSSILEVKLISLSRSNEKKIPENLSRTILIDVFNEFNVKFHKLKDNKLVLAFKNFNINYYNAAKLKLTLQAYVDMYFFCLDLKNHFEEIASKMTKSKFAVKITKNKGSFSVDIDLTIPYIYADIFDMDLTLIPCEVTRDQNNNQIHIAANVNTKHPTIDINKKNQIIDVIKSVNNNKKTVGSRHFIEDEKSSVSLDLFPFINNISDQPKQPRSSEKNKLDPRMIPHLLGFERRAKLKKEQDEERNKLKLQILEKQKLKRQLQSDKLSTVETMETVEDIQVLKQDFDQHEPEILVFQETLDKGLDALQNQLTCHPELEVIHQHYLILKQVKQQIEKGESVKKRFVHYHLIRLFQGLMNIWPLDLRSETSYQLNNMRNLLVDLILTFTGEEEMKGYLSLEPNSILCLAIKVFDYVNNSLHRVISEKVLLSDNPIYQDHQEALINKQLKPVFDNKQAFVKKLFHVISDLNAAFNAITEQNNNNDSSEDEIKLLLIELAACAREIRKNMLPRRTSDAEVEDINIRHYLSSTIRFAKELSQITLPRSYTKDGRLLRESLYPYLNHLDQDKICLLFETMTLSELLVLTIEIRNQLTHNVVSTDDRDKTVELDDNIVLLLAGFIAAKVDNKELTSEITTETVFEEYYDQDNDENYEDYNSEGSYFFLPSGHIAQYTADGLFIPIELPSAYASSNLLMFAPAARDALPEQHYDADQWAPKTN